MLTGTGPGEAVAELAVGLGDRRGSGGRGGLAGQAGPAARLGGGGFSRDRRCWAWRSAPMPPHWRCTATASSPRSPAVSRTAPPAGGAARGWCPSSKRRARWCRCWSGWRSARSRSRRRCEGLTWQIVVYAVLSLTVIRMAPVAASASAGARLGRTAVGLVGWFGPRGLASVVFALLALEEIGQPAASQAVAVITVTVLLSVVAHGVTAEPLARRFGPRLAPAADGADHRRPARCAGAQAHPAGTRRSVRTGADPARQGRVIGQPCPFLHHKARTAAPRPIHQRSGAAALPTSPTGDEVGRRSRP